MKPPHSFILLDIDGVMNSGESLHGRGVYIDPENVGRLARICRAAPGSISIHLISAWCSTEERMPGVMKKLLYCAGLNHLGQGVDGKYREEISVTNAVITKGARHTQEGILNILQNLLATDSRVNAAENAASVVIISDDYREGMHEAEPNYNNVRVMTTGRLVECRFATGLTETGADVGVKLIRDPAPWHLIADIPFPEFTRKYT